MDMKMPLCDQGFDIV